MDLHTLAERGELLWKKPCRCSTAPIAPAMKGFLGFAAFVCDWARAPHPPYTSSDFTSEITCPVAEKLPFFCKGPAPCACPAPCLSRKTSSAPAHLLGCANFDAKMVAVRADIQPPCRAYSRTPPAAPPPRPRLPRHGAENVLFVQPGT